MKPTSDTGEHLQPPQKAFHLRTKTLFWWAPQRVAKRSEQCYHGCWRNHLWRQRGKKSKVLCRWSHNKWSRPIYSVLVLVISGAKGLK